MADEGVAAMDHDLHAIAPPALLTVANEARAVLMNRFEHVRLPVSSAAQDRLFYPETISPHVASQSNPSAQRPGKQKV
jgi:hypothetical protein